MAMSETYNKAAEMVLQYLAGHSEDFAKCKPDFDQPFLADQVSKKQPLFKEIVEVVQDEFSYELSECQCSWAVSVHYRIGLEKYRKFNSLDLKPLVLFKV